MVRDEDVLLITTFWVCWLREMTTPSFARRSAIVDAHAHLYDAGANRYGVFARKDPEGTPPTAERTLDPARMFAESLTPRPELENSQDPEQTSDGHASAVERL